MSNPKTSMPSSHLQTSYCCVPNVVLRLPRNKYVGFHLFLVFE